MQTTVENLSDVALKVEVELPQLSSMASTQTPDAAASAVKGFRPKAPEGISRCTRPTSPLRLRVLVMNSISEAIDSLDHVVL